MNWVLIGSGNVATKFGEALFFAGHSISQVFSRKAENSQRLAELLEAETLTDLQKIDEEADFYLIAVSDQAIPEVVKNLNKTLKGVVLHCSGATPLSVLKDFPNSGVLYPLQTLRKETETDFRNLPLSVEGSSMEIEVTLQKIAKELSDDVSLYNSTQRLALHVSAIFANNFTNHLIGVAYKILQDNHIPEDTLRPLIQETFQKVLQNHPYDIQTGPAKRGDTLTQKRHLNFLESKKNWQEIYRLLSEEISRQQ